MSRFLATDYYLLRQCANKTARIRCWAGSRFTPRRAKWQRFTSLMGAINKAQRVGADVLLHDGTVVYTATYAERFLANEDRTRKRQYAERRPPVAEPI